VQAFESSQPATLFVKTQPKTESQESSVQMFESSQLTSLPTQDPRLQTSFSVHAFPSSQLPAVSAYWQLFAAHEADLHVISGQSPLWAQPHDEASWAQEPSMQESVVHEIPSEQSFCAPAHEPPEQTSLIVHGLLSLQVAVFGVKTQDPRLQTSLVHTLLSLQVFGVPEHEPPEQRSFIVHESPSLHASLLFVYSQPVSSSHESSVHELWSSQVIESWLQSPPSQESSVHSLSSSQSLFESQPPPQEPQSLGQDEQVSPLLQMPSPQ